MLHSSMILEEIYVNTDLVRAKVMACVASLNINFIDVLNCQFVVHLTMKNLSEICGFDSKTGYFRAKINSWIENTWEYNSALDGQIHFFKHFFYMKSVIIKRVLWSQMQPV